MGPRPVILVLIKGLGIGGAERLITEAASYWNRERFDYRVAYLLAWKDQLVPDLERQGIEVTLLGNSRGAGPAAAFRLRRHISRSKVSLVHAHLPAAGILARLTASVPVVYTEHNVVDSYRLATRLLNRITYGRNTRVTAVSPAVADSVGHYRGPRTQVVLNGVAVNVTREEAAAARDELELSPGAPLVVHVGNIRPLKGHATLVQAARWLADRREDVTLVSIGGEKYPGDLDRVRAMAAAENVDGFIRFLGRREDARAFLAAADVVVNPSDMEGLPVVLLEAMALGRPVVATAVGGVPSLIEHEHSGLLVPPSEPSQLGVSIVRLLEDQALADSLGRAGRRAVQDLYGIETMVKTIEALYEEVLSGR